MTRRLVVAAAVTLGAVGGWPAPARAADASPIDLTIEMVAPQDLSGAACAGQYAGCMSYPGSGIERRADGSTTNWTMQLLGFPDSYHGCFANQDYTSWTLTDAAGNTLYGGGSGYLGGSNMTAFGGTGRFAHYSSYFTGSTTQTLFLPVVWAGAPHGLPQICTRPTLWLGQITLHLAQEGIS